MYKDGVKTPSSLEKKIIEIVQTKEDILLQHGCIFRLYEDYKQIIKDAKNSSAIIEQFSAKLKEMTKVPYKLTNSEIFTYKDILEHYQKTYKHQREILM